MVDILRAVLPYLQIVVSTLLVIVILLQRRGAGLSSAFGGSGGGYYTRRGFERTLFMATIAFAGIFLLLAVLQLFVF